MFVIVFDDQLWIVEWREFTGWEDETKQKSKIKNVSTGKSDEKPMKQIKATAFK